MASSNEILSYLEMCQREGTSLQRGMNFRLHGGHSIVLMSVRPGAPYDDEVLEDGAVLIYEGHDHAKFRGIRDPKTLDQPERYASGTLTENGKFHAAAYRHKKIGDAPVSVPTKYEQSAVRGHISCMIKLILTRKFEMSIEGPIL